jgi:hypothetical protein
MGRLTHKEVLPCGDCNEAESGRSAGLCECGLAMQNAQFRGTAGVSGNNRGAGFVPAYRNNATGETVPSRFADGRPAVVHVLEGLPDDWIEARDTCGCVTRAMNGVIAGFLRDGRFFTREEAAQVLAASEAGLGD